MKKTTFTLLSIFAASLITNAYALDVDVTLPSAPSVSTVNEMSERQEDLKLSSLLRLKARGAQIIDERIASLESNGNAIQNSKLSADQKTSLSTIINSNITGLTTLRASIQAGTDATSTRSLVQSVYTNFRIYAIVIPQVRLEKRIYDLQNYTVRLNDAFVKVQARIDEYKSKGKDVTVWQKSLDDAKLVVASDTATLSNAMISASSLKPSDYGTSSKATISSLNNSLKTVVKDLRSLQKTVRKPVKLSNVAATTTVSTSTH